MLTKAAIALNVIIAALACKSPLLPELERRARNYIADGTIEPYVNDFMLVDHWYSVTKHEEQYLMPDSTQIPDVFACGGYEPIYIKDKHPDITMLTTTPIDVKACLKTTFHDCDYEYNIKVRKCDEEIQYYLVGGKLFSSYCLDPPSLQNGDTKFSDPPTDVKLGDVIVKPILDFDEVHRKVNGKDSTNYSPFVKFECIFDVQEHYFYVVNWYKNGILYKVLGPTEDVEELLITEKTMHQKDQINLGFTLKCGVRVSKDQTGRATTMVSSPDYFAGIKILNPRVDVPRDGKAKVEFKVTVPVGCRYNSLVNTPACDMPLSMFDPQGYKCDKANILQVKNSRRCGLDITGAKKGELWDFDKIYSFEVETGYENYNDKNDFTLQLKASDTFGHKWWNGYQPDNIQVVVSDLQIYKDKTCYAHVDPHMQTADGYNYECQEKGEYLMYRNTKYQIEVLMKTDFCNHRKAQCVCHLLIRAGADIFSINLCQKPRFIEFLSCADGGILRVLQKNDKTYQVFTPIATYIDITILGPGTYDRFMNVDIHMSPKDLKQTEGLCGYMDGKQTNDLTKRNQDILTIRGGSTYSRHFPDFIRSWRRQINYGHWQFPRKVDKLSLPLRLKDDENLFKSLKAKQLNPWQDMNAMYCVCEQAIQGNKQPKQAHGRVAKALCSPTQYLDCDLKRPTVTNRKCNKIANTNQKQRRSVRSVTHVYAKHMREAERLMGLANRPRRDTHHVERRSESGQNISESEAQHYCANAIGGSHVMSNIPESLPGNGSAAVIDQCIFDVLAGNSLKLADVHVDAINTMAQAKIKLDPVYVANNTAEVEIFIKNSCPGNCSQRGNCSDKGECECYQYFHGSDCSIDERDPVEIDDLEGGGLCNLTDGDGCECFYFRTNNLLSNFSCAISGAITYIDDTEENITISVDNGEYEDIFTGLCCAPKKREKRSTEQTFEFSRRYDIAISNDGQTFGEGESLHVYSSECQDAIPDADIGYRIVLKDGHCFIGGVCASNKEVSVSDECLTCEPHISVYKWTQSCKPKDSDDGHLGTIVGAAIGGIIIVVVAVGLLYFKLRHRSKTQKSDRGVQYFSTSTDEKTELNDS